jgi:hypothetical protein
VKADRVLGFVALLAMAGLTGFACQDKAPQVWHGPDDSSFRPADPPAADTPARAAAPTAPPTPAFPPFGTPRAPVVVAPALTDAGSSVATTPPPDPDLPIVDAARVRAAGCFARVPIAADIAPPSRSASLSLTVVPTGRVTRTEVRASGAQGGPPEPELVDCLKRVGDGTTFTSKEASPGKDAGIRTSSLGGDLRSITIDVTVTSSH